MRTLLFITACLLVHYGHPWPAILLVGCLWLSDWAQLETTRELLVLEKDLQHYSPQMRLVRRFHQN